MFRWNPTLINLYVLYVNPIQRFICGPTLAVIILCSISPLLMQHRFVLNILSHTLSHTPYLSHNLHALLLVYVSILSFSPLSISLSILRVYAQTSFYQENLAFCFQLCTVTHFVGFLLLPWFSSSLVFSLTAE
jgi:hypothetical protein